MAKQDDILSSLDQLLEQDRFTDDSLNGLQVDGCPEEVTKIGVAVDAGKSVFEAAVLAKCNFLIVHHGLFWGAPCRLTGVLRDKVMILLENRCSLYASHLPLDGHQELGNAAQIADVLHLTDRSPFCFLDGEPLGVKGSLPKSSPPDVVAQAASQFAGASTPLLLPFGEKAVRSIGIVTGSGAFAIEQAKSEGLDLLLTGEPKQMAYHLAQELKINVLFGGHYATETFGVRALGSYLEKQLKVPFEFIDIPTGI